jgi:hypothetical protein
MVVVALSFFGTNFTQDIPLIVILTHIFQYNDVYAMA